MVSTSAYFISRKNYADKSFPNIVIKKLTPGFDRGIFTDKIAYTIKVKFVNIGENALARVFLIGEQKGLGQRKKLIYYPKLIVRPFEETDVYLVINEKDIIYKTHPKENVLISLTVILEDYRGELYQYQFKVTIPSHKIEKDDLRIHVGQRPKKLKFLKRRQILNNYNKAPDWLEYQVKDEKSPEHKTAMKFKIYSELEKKKML